MPIIYNQEEARLWESISIGGNDISIIRKKDGRHKSINRRNSSYSKKLRNKLTPSNLKKLLYLGYQLR